MAAGVLKRLKSRKAEGRVEALEEHWNLARDYLDRAVHYDEREDHARAIPHYKDAVEVCDLGLKIDVPTSGPSTEQNTQRRRELHEWMSLAAKRLAALRGPRAAAAAAAAQAAPVRKDRPRQAVGRTTPSSLKKPAAAPLPRPRARPAGAAEGGSGNPLMDRILSEVVQSDPGARWQDIAGLTSAKEALKESVILPCLRPDLFSGLRSPARGLLLYGPPGNGKTMLARALAGEANATFFCISASSLASKWHGEGEQLVRALFQAAQDRSPSVVFIDEIDSLLSARSSNEHEANRKLKTEFLVQMDGLLGEGDARVFVLGATNRPWDLDEAVRRRMPKKIYIPLPSAEGRRAVFARLFHGQLSDKDLKRLVKATDGYSGSDVNALCKEAAMGPLREMGPSELLTADARRIRPVRLADFEPALQAIRPSTDAQQLKQYEEFTRVHGVQA
ncbi:unnamed protein product [Pedinophyceae sp. YPF-701]|nr:unnamed protein product [Pedinophyceae sp. YPF-701]